MILFCGYDAEKKKGNIAYLSAPFKKLEKQTFPRSAFPCQHHLSQWPIPGIQNPGGRADK